MDLYTVGAGDMIVLSDLIYYNVSPLNSHQILLLLFIIIYYFIVIDSNVRHTQKKALSDGNWQNRRLITIRKTYIFGLNILIDFVRMLWRSNAIPI